MACVFKPGVGNLFEFFFFFFLHEFFIIAGWRQNQVILSYNSTFI